MRFKITAALFVILSAAAGFFIMSLLGGGTVKPADIASGVLFQDNGNPKTLAAQGQYLNNAFLRKKSLGFRTIDITLTDTAPYGLKSAPAMVMADSVNEGWALGSGQLVGAVDIDQPDRIFYFIGAATGDCQNLIEVPLAPAELWHQSFQNGKALFQQNQKIPVAGCFVSEDEQRIFYQLVRKRNAIN